MRLASAALAAAMLWTQLALAAAAPTVQADDPYALLEAAAQATSALRTVRFSTTSETRLAGGPQPAGEAGLNGLTSRGEYEAPDRLHLVSEAGPGSPSFESIIIGRTWTRAGNGEWRSGTQGPGALSAELRQAASLAVNPTVADQGGDYVVTTDLDLARAPSGGSLFGSGFGAMPTPGLQGGGTATATITIDKSTYFLKSVQMTLTPAAGSGSFLLPAGMATATVVTLSDFNDPSITVSEPR
jgi:hypothetical protein